MDQQQQQNKMHKQDQDPVAPRLQVWPGHCKEEVGPNWPDADLLCFRPAQSEMFLCD